MHGFIFWLSLSVIILSYMTLWFALALYTHRYDVVDSAWGLGFVLVAWTSLSLRGSFSGAQIVSAILVSLWGIRLFGHIANRNWRKSQDDHRYEALRAKWGAAEKRKAYTNVFLLQGALIVIVSLPMIAIAFASRSAHMNLLTYIGWAIWVIGIGFEAIADRQLHSFIQHRPADSHALMNTGLWRYSRHPNYFGEVTTWWGAALVTISLHTWWGVFGALAITLLITKVSGIPPLEKHYKGNKDYEAYARRTSILIPLPPRKAR